MSTSDHENGAKSRSNGSAHSTGPFSWKRRAQTFDTGVEPKKTLKHIVDKKVIQNQKINTYKYQPIAYHDEIRILKIIHGQRSEALRCMLVPSPLVPSTLQSSADPSESTMRSHTYRALSYWWGEDAPTHPIIMIDETDIRKGLLDLPRIFYVRDNLAAALTEIRDEKENIDVWVDALCINQADLTEKNAQVARMDDIYREAEEVYVWLGAGKDKTNETFEFLRSILKLPNFETLIETGKDKKNLDKWMLIVNLMKNRWFSRRWVIQELALARKATVLWGQESISWQDFADAIALFMTKHDEIKDMLESIKPSFDVMSDPAAYIGGLEPRALGANTLVDAHSTLFRRSDDGIIQQRLLSLEILVSSLFLPFEASEPRDTVYAVLSLAKDTATKVKLSDPPSWPIPPKPHLTLRILYQVLNYVFIFVCWLGKWFRRKQPMVAPTNPPPNASIDHRIRPDYDKRLIDVFADFMEYCIERSGSLDILCRHWAPRQKKLKPLEKLQIEKQGGLEDETMPSWILSIEGHAYGAPLGRLRGRSNGDSFVGGHARHNKHYDACGGLSPFVQFGKYKSQKRKEQGKRRQNGKVGEGKAAPKGVVPVAIDSEPIVTSPAAQTPQPRLKRFDGTLRVKGFRVDFIKKASGRVLDGVIPSRALEWAGWPRPDDSAPSAQAPELPDRLWRTLVADRDPDGNNAPPWYRRACLECLSYVNPSGDLNTEQFKNVERTPASVKMFISRVKAVVWCRQFIVTEGKRNNGNPLFGLAPPETQSGDIICILFGCSVPVVLRKQPSPGRSRVDRYTFIGECYVHGIMDGEAIPTEEPVHPYSNFGDFVIV